MEYKPKTNAELFILTENGFIFRNRLIDLKEIGYI